LGAAGFVSGFCGIYDVEMMETQKRKTGARFHLFNDHFQNFKSYGIPKAQLVIADIPYNLGINAYASNPSWYVDGDNSNGESALAGTEFFDTDKDFRITEFLHFCSTLMMKEPKETGKAPCMIVFCAFEQQFEIIQKAKNYGLNKYINLVFRKNFSAQVLKANMRIVGNCEYGLLLYRDKLPKFNNDRKMIFNCIDWDRDNVTKKIHPTQKPVKMLERLIKVFTDEGDVVIDPCAGSGSSLLAAINCKRRAYGFEIKKDFYRDALTLLQEKKAEIDEVEKYGFSPSVLEKVHPGLFSNLIESIV
jgi:site-specific DNA-methyltransferase (adenine-specific)